MKRYVKISIISFILLAIAIILLILNLTFITNLIAICASLIQIIMFLFWNVKDKTEEKLDKTNQGLEKLDIQMVNFNDALKEINNYEFKETKENEKKDEILRNILSCGLIPYNEIIKLIPRLRGKEFFIVCCWGGKILRSVSDLEREYYPDREILSSLNFISVYKNNTVFVKFKEDLPIKYRSLINLKKLIN